MKRKMQILRETQKRKENTKIVEENKYFRTNMRIILEYVRITRDKDVFHLVKLE